MGPDYEKRGQSGGLPHPGGPNVQNDPGFSSTARILLSPDTGKARRVRHDVHRNLARLGVVVDPLTNTPTGAPCGHVSFLGTPLDGFICSFVSGKRFEVLLGDSQISLFRIIYDHACYFPPIVFYGDVFMR